MDALPSVLEVCRLPDTLLGEAYEATPPSCRGWIKTTLALVEAIHAPLPSCIEQRTENTAAGYGTLLRQTIAPWAALVIGPDFRSPIRLSAAIMSARLAGVEPLVAIWTGTAEALPPALLAALELTGVEQCFAMPNPAPLLTALRSGGQGRILGFGGVEASLRETAHQLHLPLWEDIHYPLLGVLSTTVASDDFDRDIIRWAHPDACLVSVTPDVSTTEAYTAIYAPLAATLPPVALRLSPGLEGAWLCPNLPPSFFSTATRTLYGLQLS